MAYHFKQLSYANPGGPDNLTQDSFWFEFLKFMTSSPANGGPGWTLKAYGRGRNATGTIVTSDGFQLNGNYDPTQVWNATNPLAFFDTTNSRNFSNSGRWFIIQEPATNRNYRREFLFHTGNRDNYAAVWGGTNSSNINMINYMDNQCYHTIYYSAQGFLTTATGNGFNSADVSAINPPIAYDMINLNQTDMTNPQTSPNGAWTYCNPVNGSYSRGTFGQRKSDQGPSNTPWQYTICAADNTSSEGYGWYIAIYMKNWLYPVRFFCYDPLVSGSYDSAQLDPVIIHNEVNSNAWNGGTGNTLWQDSGSLADGSRPAYNTAHQYGHHVCWAKRPLTFSSKTDVTNQTTSTGSYTAQVCRVNSPVYIRSSSTPQSLNGKLTTLPMPFVLYNYPGLSTNEFWIGQSSMMKFCLHTSLSCMQTVNINTLRDYLHFCPNGVRILIPWDGTVPPT
jgi:hypothetical protein